MQIVQNLAQAAQRSAVSRRNGDSSDTFMAIRMVEPLVTNDLPLVEPLLTNSYTDSYISLTIILVVKQ